MTYFAFTTLATVGFGDYSPRSDSERFFGAFFLLFGVATFTVIQSNFTEMIDKLQRFNDENEGDQNLNKFFLTLRKFNNMKAIDQKLKIEIETYFEYRYKKDKNYAFQTINDLSIFDQLP